MSSGSFHSGCFHGVQTFRERCTESQQSHVGVRSSLPLAAVSQLKSTLINQVRVSENQQGHAC
jgi:hypothetical protein